MIEKEQPIEAPMRKVMNDIGNLLGDAIRESGGGYGFALLVFPFGDDPGGRMNYVSNARREDMLVAMKEFIARNEGRYEEADFTKRKV
jgi:hypothetical protein